MSAGKALIGGIDIRPAAILLFAFGLYARSLGYDFVYDDKVRLLGDYLIFQVPFSLETSLKLFVSPTIPGDLYRPLSTLSFWIDGRLWGPNPAGFHLVNIVLHGLAGIMACLIFEHMSGSRRFSFCMALLFLCHPICVESVANISGRPELIVALFGLISTFFAIKIDTQPAGIKKLLCCALSAFSFLLAVLSKESAAVLLVVTPLLVYWKRREVSPALFYPFFCHALVFCAYLFLRHQALPGGIAPPRTIYCEAENPFAWQGLTALERMVPAAIYLGKYIFNIFFPVRLLVDYSLSCELFFREVYSLRGSLMALLTVVFFSCALAARKKTYGVFGLWFFAAFLVTSNIFMPIGTVMGDRLCYLPLIGAVGFAGGAVCDYTRSRKVTITLFVLAAGVLTLLTFERIKIWQNDTHLFLESVKEAPLNPRAHEAAGKELLITLGRQDEAEKEFLKAVELDPSRVEALLFLSSINCRKKNLEKAAEFAQKVLKYEPQNDEAKNMLAGLTARCR